MFPYHLRRTSDALQGRYPGVANEARELQSKLEVEVAKTVFGVARFVVLLVATALLLGGWGLEGQEPLARPELPIKRDLPPLPANTCEAAGFEASIVEAPSSQAAAEAERAASDASQAAILGQNERARALLMEAVARDPTSAPISYRLGRLLEESEDLDEALAEYCRFLAISSAGAEVDEVQQRVERIGEAVGAMGEATAYSAFEDGIEAFDQGDFDNAVLNFSRALVESPDWEPAHFNRGVSYLMSGRDGAAAADLEWYLQLVPNAADRAQVEGILASMESEPAIRYSSATAFVSGLFIPGMGHFYTGRPGLGALVLGAAGGSAAFGLLHKTIEIQCSSPLVDGQCPQGSTISTKESRPLLVPGLAAFGVITVLAAIHASRSANRGAVQLSRAGGVEGRLTGVRVAGSAPILRIEPTFDPRGGSGLRAELEVRF